MLRGVTVGCGFFGRIQMQAWKRVEGAEIVAACDLDLQKLESFSTEFELQAYQDLEQMLDEVKPDFVDIATRPSTHAPLTRVVANRKIPILLQKPMAETWTEAREIVRIAQAEGVRLMINENWRWQRWYREIKARLDAGAIGRPFYYAIHTRARDGLGAAPYPNQPYFKQMPRLLLIETLVHHLDTARFLLGEIAEVYCQTERLNPAITAEDLAIVMTLHRSGVRGVVDGNRACEPDEAGEALEFSRIEGLDGKIRLLHSGDVLLNDEKIFSGAGLPGYRGDSCRATQQHFIQSLLVGCEFETAAADYLEKTFAVVEACYLSAAENRPVRIEEIVSRS